MLEVDAVCYFSFPAVIIFFFDHMGSVACFSFSTSAFLLSVQRMKYQDFHDLMRFHIVDNN